MKPLFHSSQETELMPTSRLKQFYEDLAREVIEVVGPKFNIKEADIGFLDQYPKPPAALLRTPASGT